MNNVFHLVFRLHLLKVRLSHTQGNVAFLTIHVENFDSNLVTDADEIGHTNARHAAEYRKKRPGIRAILSNSARLLGRHEWSWSTSLWCR